MMILNGRAARNIYLSIATYDNIQPSVSLWFLKNVTGKILKPELGDAEMQFALRWRRTDSGRMFVAPVDVQSWKKISDEFPLEWIALSIWKESNRAEGKNPAIAAATAHFSQDPTRASTLEFSASVEIFGNTIDRSCQSHVVELALATFSKVEGIVGYITVDYVSANVYGSMSPYERAIGLSYPQAAREFMSKVRGYYWGNLLHRNHIELLGGSAILSEAPAHLVKSVDADRYYLQLTDDINNIDRERLANLKEFLTPILPVGFPQSPEYYQSLPDLLL